jgi:cell division protein FtsW (lipid II flippase)
MTFLGMMTYYSSTGNNVMFEKQLISLVISIFGYFLISFLDVRYLKNNNLNLGLYIFVVSLFAVLAIIGGAFSGAQS